MKYLTQSHTQPPRHIQSGDMLVPTAPHIKAGNTAWLARHGIYPHVTIEGDAPLSYTDWTFANGQYTRQPAGTPAEREAARLQQRRESQSISRLQARLYLLGMPNAAHGTTWGAVQAWAQGQGGEVQAYFEDAQHWNRLDNHVQAGAAEFGWDAATLDQMFDDAAAGRTAGDAPTDVNTATQAELERLPGVGAALAQEIIAGRPWTDTSHLSSISGISEAMIQSWPVTV